jgi:hypothetical protein
MTVRKGLNDLCGLGVLRGLIFPNLFEGGTTENTEDTENSGKAIREGERQIR